MKKLLSNTREHINITSSVEKFCTACECSTTHRVDDALCYCTKCEKYKLKLIYKYKDLHK